MCSSIYGQINVHYQCLLAMLFLAYYQGNQTKNDYGPCLLIPMQECRKVCVCVCIKQGNQTKKCVCVLKKIKKQGYQRMNTYNAGMKCEPGCVDWPLYRFFPIVFQTCWNKYFIPWINRGLQCWHNTIKYCISNTNWDLF